MPNPQGVEKENALRAAGFQEADIQQWRSQTANDLMGAGFSVSEIDTYFGAKNPDMNPLKEIIDTNMKSAANSEAASTASSETKPLKKAQSFTEAFESGFQISVSGLIKRGEMPDTVLPEDAPMYYRMASQIGTLSGDIPAMLAGGAAAGAAAAPVAAMTGPAAPVVEAAAVGYGSFALPEAVRSQLMQYYEKGEITSAGDFWERAGVTFIDSQKAGLIGAATAGVGGTVGKVLAPVAKPAIKTAAQVSSEVATMVTVGKALEGETPEPQDFLDAAVLVGGLHGTMKATSKIRQVYAKTGVKPAELAERAINDPLIKQDLLVENPGIPETLAREHGVKSKNPLEAKVSGLKDETPGPTRTEAQSKILEQIGEKAPKEGEPLLPTAREAYKDFVDKLDPINEVVKKLNIDPKSLKADENPYMLARMANDYKAKTKYVFEKGTLDYKTLAKTGESFSQIIKPVKADPRGFEAYLAAKRAIEVEGVGKKSGFDLKAAEQVVKEGKTKYEETAQKLYDFKNKNLEYLKDSGVISKEEFGNMVELNKSHVSFSRILEDNKGGTGAGPRKLGTLKEFKGSSLKIESPLLATLENTEMMFKLAEKNRATGSLIKLAENTKDQSLLSQVSAPKGKLKESEFEFYRNGEREVWVSADKSVAQAIKSLDGDMVATNMFMRVAQKITSFKKLTITITPDFILKNLFRDQLTMGAFSKGGSRPFLDILPAMKDIIAKNDTYYNWLKAGGAQGTFLDLSKTYLSKQVFELNTKTGFIDSAWNVLKKPVDYLQAAGALAEHATRIAEFKRVTKGATEGSKIFEGGFNSREITIDFSRSGAKLSALNGITAFQNMSIQGLDRTIRAIKEDPTGVGMKATAYITVPSLLLWWANHDDERYKNLPRWQKDLFWIIPTDKWEKASEEQASTLPDYLVRKNSKGETEINNGVIFRIPKPQELGILFGTVPERTMEAFFTDNPHALKDFNETMTQLVTPAIVPDAVAPITEQWANKSLFTGNKIAAGPIEKVLPAYQYNEYTTESAKQIAKMIRVLPGTESGDLPISSPVVVENYIRAWSGNVGMYTLQMSDKALEKAGVLPDPVKPQDTLSDIPFVKAFVVRYPSSGAQPIQDFYENYAKHEKVRNTIARLQKTGEYDALEKELNDPEIQSMMINLKGVNEALAQQAATARRIYKNPEFSPEDQRQLLDGIYYGMIETAKAGNDIMETVDKSLSK